MNNCTDLSKNKSNDKNNSNSFSNQYEPEAVQEERYVICDNVYFEKNGKNYLIVNLSSCECVFTNELQAKIFELILSNTEYFELIDKIAETLSIKNKKLCLTIFADKFIDKLLSKGIIKPYTNIE